MANRHWEQDKEATVYIGNLDERVSDSIVWELMLQAGRIVSIHLPKDRVTQTHQGFGFVQFVTEEDAEYAARIMNQVRLYGKPIRVNKASADKQKTVEVGAELFVGNLDPMVDEKTLYDTFSTFGSLIAAPKIARDDNGISRGFGFVSFDNFDSTDKAIESMNNQFLMNKEITVSYAYKKDGKGERHGDTAERLLASQARKNNVQVQMYNLPPALVAPPNAPSAPAVPDYSQVPPPRAPQQQQQQQQQQIQQPYAPAQQGYPPQGYPSQGFQAQVYAPPPQQGMRPTPPPQMSHGLPARPPPPSGFNSTPYGAVPPPAGFGIPPPQGFGGPPAGFQGQPQMGYGAPPPMGFPPGGMPPQGFGNLLPPPMGFQQQQQQPQGGYRR